MPIMIFMTRLYNKSGVRRGSSNLRKHILIITGSIFLLFSAVSCEKQVLSLGSDLLPTSDFVKISPIDTFSLFSFTRYTDSIATNSPSESYLGSLYDPYFGTTSCSFVTQLKLRYRWPGLAFTTDSVKLYLHITSTKGGTAGATHTLSLYEISDDLDADSTYYSTTPVHTTSFKITDIVLPKLRTDTINDLELSLPGLGLEFANYILRDTTKLHYSSTGGIFPSYFKGFYFKMDDSSDPLLMKLSLKSDQQSYYNYITIFGKDESGTNQEFSFLLDARTGTVSYNIFRHDYSTATQGNKMVYKNTNYRDSLAYFQAFNGVYTEVDIPGLEKIKESSALSNVAINRARLVVPIQFKPSGNNYYSNSLPSIMRLRYKASTGKRYEVPDYLMGSSTKFFDGTLDSVNNVYNFNIPAFVQAYLEDKTGLVKPVLEIFQNTGTTNAVFKVNNSKKPARFEFAYTKF